MSKTKVLATSIGLALALGCSGTEGGAESGAADGPPDAGGAASPGEGTPTDGRGTPADVSSASADGGGVTMSCEDGGAFSGPQLRDCDLPGACGRCLWEKACSSFLFRCAHDADCVCMAECVGTSGVSGAERCLGECGLTESPPGFAEWVKGAADMCWDEGCGTLDEPPPEAPVSTSGGSTGAGTEPDCDFDTGLTYDPCGEVLQLESADGSLCARIERRNDGAGNDANTSWTLLDVRIGPLGQVCHAAEPEALCWFSSHHNYAEWLHVSCGDLHYDLNIGKGCGKLSRPSSTFRLHVFEHGPTADSCAPTADGSCPVVAPMDLYPVP